MKLTLFPRDQVESMRESQEFLFCEYMLQTRTQKTLQRGRPNTPSMETRTMSSASTLIQKPMTEYWSLKRYSRLACPLLPGMQNIQCCFVCSCYAGLGKYILWRVKFEHHCFSRSDLIIIIKIIHFIYRALFKVLKYTY